MEKGSVTIDMYNMGAVHIADGTFSIVRRPANASVNPEWDKEVTDLHTRLAMRHTTVIDYASRFLQYFSLVAGKQGVTVQFTTPPIDYEMDWTIKY